MNIPTLFGKFLQEDHNTKVLNALQASNALLTRQVNSLVTEVQGSTDITTNTDSTSTYSYAGTPSKFNS